LPELPEIETVKLGIEKTVLGRVIISTKILRRDLRFPIEENFEKLILNKRVLGVGRRSKYLLFFLNKKTAYKVKKHDHLIMSFDNGSFLTYNDPRRFGFVETLVGDHNGYRRFKHLGLDPLSKKFDGKHLWFNIKNSTRTLKNILMDQKVIAGLGNIYVSEALWDSKINPTRVGKSMSLIDCKKLVVSIKKVLDKAIKFGGTTLKDFRHIGGEVGYFQNKLQVYGKEGQACFRKKCKGTVEKIVISGRSTFYCSTCQK
jgi:formamidopyrimidine-DNA glycosylase